MDKLELARNINTDPAELARLSSDEDARIRANVARNPSTPQEALIRLASDKDARIRCVVASNPSTPREALESLLLDPDVHDTVFSVLLKRNKKSEQA